MSERPRLLTAEERREAAREAARRASEAGSGSQSYLRQLLNDPIGTGYSEDIPRHEEGVFRKIISVILVALLATATVWITRELLRVRAGATTVRQTLMEEAQRRLDDQTRLETAIENLGKEIKAKQDELVPLDPNQEKFGNLLAAVSGRAAVSGPGVTVEIDDTSVTNVEGRVRDFDLQVVVNALWASGAEAVSINGQRLGTRTALRTAGQTILVNVSPLTPPYRIEVIAEPTDLQVNFANTRAAGHLAMLRDTFGVVVAINTADELTLPAAPSSPIRFAEVVKTDSAGNLIG